MKKRLILSRSAVQVSAPGVDVDAAADLDRLFDTSASQLRVVARGMLTMYQSDPRDSVNLAQQREILLGRTFDRAPLGFFGFHRWEGGSQIPSPPDLANAVQLQFGKRYSTYAGSMTGDPYPTSGNTAHWYALLAMPDRIRLRWYYSTSNQYSEQSRSRPYDQNFYYTIMAYT